jgi:hypothetical protein
MYEWNNDMVEDAKFAFSTGFVYRHLPTTMDAAIGFLSDRTAFAFERSAPAEDLWESNTRIVSKLTQTLVLIANIYFGNGQANGDSERTINRSGGDVRAIYRKVKVVTSLKFNDWGPFDYHRDFNLTYPGYKVQWISQLQLENQIGLFYLIQESESWEFGVH